MAGLLLIHALATPDFILGEYGRNATVGLAGALAVPAGAPWMKISEVIDYVLALKPRRTFPTHEMLLSRAGKDLSNARIKGATEQAGGEFFPLEPHESLDV